MRYTRMTRQERSILEARVKENPDVTVSELARGLHRDRKTIRNELSRFPSRRLYNAAKAQRMAGEAAKRPGERRMTEQMKCELRHRLKRVEERKAAGHYEGDLINGADGYHIFTLVERVSRFTFWDVLPSKEARHVAAAAGACLSALPRALRRSLTFDNGKENAALWKLGPLLSDGVFFAKPYHSWERGTNENRNGVVRIVKPKGSAFGGLTPDERERIEHVLNDRPMKCLQWRTPREVYAALLVEAAEAK